MPVPGGPINMVTSYIFDKFIRLSSLPEAMQWPVPLPIALASALELQ